LLLGQNPVSSEWRHHGQRIALGFVEYDLDQLVPFVLAFYVGQFGPKGAGIFAALDYVTSQAIAFAAVEAELFSLGGGLGMGGGGSSEAGQQRQHRREVPAKGGDQGVSRAFVDGRMRNIGSQKHKGHRLAMRTKDTEKRGLITLGSGPGSRV